MKALIIQHEKDTPPGSTVEWLKQKNIDFEIVFPSEGLKHLDQNKFELLFICGGSMNVDQEDLYPWLVEEKKLISHFILGKKKIMGLCLGSQLLAEILGGKVRPHPFWEVGWQTVQLENNLPLVVFQWHAYSSTLPPGAKLRASNDACHCQGFSYNQNILAFQFHPEADANWIMECANDPDLPKKDRYVQSKSEIIDSIGFQEKLQDWYFLELDSFLIH